VTSPRRPTTWFDDARGGLRSIVLEALIVVAVGVVAVGIAWIAIAVI
jgi:hypothetical protein